MSSRPVYRTCAWWRHLVNAYGVISLVRLIAALSAACGSFLPG